MMLQYLSSSLVTLLVMFKCFQHVKLFAFTVTVLCNMQVQTEVGLVL